jgi:transcription elongation factor GreA
MPEHIKKKLLEEIKQLEHELQHELPAEIKKAAAFGDLSENAEYHMAKQRQVFVNARLGQLKARMGELALVNLTNIPRDRDRLRLDRHRLRHHQGRKDRVQAGHQRRVRRQQGTDLDHLAHRRGLVGKQVGDVATVVTPNGKRELEILKLITIHDEAE